MSSEEKISPERQIMNWLEANINEFNVDTTCVCTNFVLVAEFVDTSGQWYSLALYDKNTPEWRLRGLVDHVMSSLDDDDEDEEEEDY